MVTKKKTAITDIQENTETIIAYNCEVCLSLFDFRQNNRSFPFVHLLEHVHL